jgi:hypothetical protein
VLHLHYTVKRWPVFPRLRVATCFANEFTADLLAAYDTPGLVVHSTETTLAVDDRQVSAVGATGCPAP